MPSTAVPLAVELLYEQSPKLDADRIAKRVQETLSGTVALAKEPGVMLAHEDFPQQFEDGPKAILTLIVPPDANKDGVAAGDFDLTQSWAFHEAHEAVEQASSTLLVAEMVGTGAPPEQRVKAFRTALQALVEETGALAIWSPAANEMLGPDNLDDHPLGGLVNVRLYRVEDEEGVMLMDTLGLHTLGMPDFQIHFRDLDESAVGKSILDLAVHALEHPGEVESGHTVSGPNGDERWRLQLENALVPPERPVLDVDPGDKYAAGDRTR